jgi:hypothetical protein
VEFSVASRSHENFVDTQTISVLAANQFRPISIPPSGYVRRVSLFFCFTMTCASDPALVAGDAPWNLISSITLTDAQGQPLFHPITGYNLYLLNKYGFHGTHKTNTLKNWFNPHMSPEYAWATVSTTGATATFRLDLDLEVDYNSGYGSVPNTDSNTTLQLRIATSAYTVAATGTTVSAADLTVQVEQEYWAPVASTMGAATVNVTPPAIGDFVDNRYENHTATAAAANQVRIATRGGLSPWYIIVSRAAGVRTAIAPASNVNYELDNVPVQQSITLESHNHRVRQSYGYHGTDLALSYVPITAGTVTGLDRGVLVIPFYALAGGRHPYYNTRTGSQSVVTYTTGAAVDQTEVLAPLMQITNAAAFYGASAID